MGVGGSRCRPSRRAQPLKTERYAKLAALFIQTDHRPAYEQLRQKLLGMFANTSNIYAADQVAKACLFLAPGRGGLAGDRPLGQHSRDLRDWSSGAMPYFQVCKALSEYRQGHFAQALDWAQRTTKTTAIYAQGQAYAVLAMACWRQGEKDRARLMLGLGNTGAARTSLSGGTKEDRRTHGRPGSLGEFRWMKRPHS